MISKNITDSLEGLVRYLKLKTTKDRMYFTLFQRLKLGTSIDYLNYTVLDEVNIPSKLYNCGGDGYCYQSGLI